MEGYAGAAAQGRRTLRARVYTLLDGEGRTRGSAAIRTVMVSVIVVNAAVIVLTTVKSLSTIYGGLFDAIADAALMIFAVDYAARIWTAPEGESTSGHSTWSARVAYVTSALGIVDLVAVLP